MFVMNGLLTEVRHHVRLRSTLTSLPFKINREQVNNIITNDKNYFEKDNEHERVTDTKDKLELFKGDPVTRRYIPFHTASVDNMYSSFEGEYGIDRVETYTKYVMKHKVMQPEPHVRIVTDWYRCYGTTIATDYPLGASNTQIYADFKYPREHIEQSLRTEDIKNLRKIARDKSAILDVHSMNMSYGIEKIIAAIHQMETDKAEESIRNDYRADHVRISTLDMHVERARIVPKSYHIPAYIYKNKLGSGHSEIKVISGYDGTIKGDKFYSPQKVGIAWGSIGLVLGILTMPLRASPQVTLAMIGARAAIATGIFGGLAAMWAKYYTEYKYRKHREQLKKEREYNRFTKETDDDKRRKSFGETDRKINTKEKKNTVLYGYTTECRILGIDPKSEITLALLKEQYRKSLMKWHPDHHKENRKLANDMTTRINEAYQELKKVVK